MTQPDLCTRCQQRERYARLLVCGACADELVGRASKVVPFEPAWRRYVRENSRVRVDWGKAA